MRLLRGRERSSRSSSGASAECDRERARRKTAGILDVFRGFFEDESRERARPRAGNERLTRSRPHTVPILDREEVDVISGSCKVGPLPPLLCKRAFGGCRFRVMSQVLLRAMEADASGRAPSPNRLQNQGRFLCTGGDSSALVGWSKALRYQNLEQERRAISPCCRMVVERVRIPSTAPPLSK